MSLLVLLLCVLISPWVPDVNGYYRGINLHGGWQGIEGGSPSVFAPGWHLDFFKARGFNVFRVGFAWQQLQTSLNSALNPPYLKQMDDFVAEAQSRGLFVGFVPLPGNYQGKHIGTQVPISAFIDMWTRLATHYKGNPTVWAYDLINEPDDVDQADSWNIQWGPATVRAIRTIDTEKYILFPTSTGGWGHYFLSHTGGLPIQDPANKVIYQAHFYFDASASGQYVNGYDAPSLDIGVQRARGFALWCATNKVKCLAGEYGIPGGWVAGNENCTWGNADVDSRWNTVLDTFLSYIDKFDISGNYWNGGPYSDVTDIGPTCDGIVRKQMPIIIAHVGTDANPTAWFQKPVPPMPIPNTPEIVYHDTLQNGYVNNGWGTVDLKCTSPVHSGTYSIKMYYNNWVGVWFQILGGISTQQYKSISYWVYPTSSEQNMKVQASHDGVAVGTTVMPTFSAVNQWQQIVIDFTALGVKTGAILDGFWIQENSAADQGVLYMDDVTLINF